MVFFKYGLSEENYKEQYKILCKLHHPDNGGSNNQFILLKEEFEECLILTKHWEKIQEYFDCNVQVKEVVRMEKIFVPSPPPLPKEPPKPIITDAGLKTTAEIFLAGRDIFKEITKSIKEIKKQPRTVKTTLKK